MSGDRGDGKVVAKGWEEEPDYLTEEEKDVLRREGWVEFLPRNWESRRGGGLLIAWAHRNVEAFREELRLKAAEEAGNYRLGPLRAHVGDRLVWFRLWERGPGFQVKDAERHPLLFSQRGRGVRVGRWWLRLFGPERKAR